MDGLDAFLNGTDAPEEEHPAPAAEEPKDPAGAPAEAAPEAKAPGQPRDAKGQFVPKGDKPQGEDVTPEPGAPPAPKDEAPLDHPALLGERRRRQDAERELEELRQRLAPAPAPTPAVGAPAVGDAPPDRFEDPDGYDRWLIATARQQAVMALQEERIAQSATTARTKYPDWEEKATVFANLARSNPALEHTLRNHPNPAEYAYSTAKMHQELQQHGSLEALIAAREEAARVAARAEAETIAPSTSSAIPQSLAGHQSARPSTAAMPAGPPSLEDILKRK